MADLSKIKVGDKLKLEVVVTMVETPQYVGQMAVQVKSVEGRFSDSYIWMDRPAIAAAEHIPAPRVFKRGDWVKWRDGTKQMVVGDDYGGSLWVTSEDPASNIIWRKQDCEHTEAPE